MATSIPVARRATATVERWRQRTLRSGARDIEPRLAWIFGSPRSGSTWLQKLLREHPSVIGVNEPLIGGYLGQMSADLRDIDIGALDADTFLVRRVQSTRPDDFFAEEFRDVWLPALGDMMRRRFAAHAEKYARRVAPSRALLAIQEPNGSQSADVIMAALPRARFLFLLRDGRDVVDSELAANQPGGWLTEAFEGLAAVTAEQRLQFTERAARKWVWRTQVVREAFEAHAGPKLLLRYEQLREDPSLHLRSVLDWLGLEASDGDLQAMVERHSFERLPDHRRGDKAFFRAASPGLWRENLSADEQAVLQEIMGPTLRELGYQA